ncbi:sugar transferase [Ruminiclostridium herbifermentans]|uniref:Sugar transferase n=1 Tax=Ruminiclostridium herbifermentans TaxID=2488810 RepID=A0A4U7JI74_9FIRM|nr:sugar transferase [Ruminiclostridium herbifermentans]QNU66610.1 sugar transferase [Ruminiclostridium herbifermentans]
MKDIEYTADYVVGQRAMYGNVSLLYLFGKRVFDIIASLTAIIILLPLFLVVIILIKIDSPGGVFFSQKRNGFRGKCFNMYKFRSMVIDAEDKFKELEDKNEVSGNMFKIKNDPRITRVGKILRKTSIDELPQLFNVIKGDMSIVGPRPPIGREVQKYDSWHNLRLSVKPGITGLWQVSGRNDIGFEDMCRLDLKYIRERGFLYDLKIIIKTIPVIFGDSRAF